jgi:hypothetical protein
MEEFEKKDLVGLRVVVGFVPSCRPSCRVVGVMPSCSLYVES